MNFPTDLKYTKSDEWIRVTGSEAEAGLTDYAQSHLSDIVYVELPEVGAEFKQGDVFRLDRVGEGRVGSEPAGQRHDHGRQRRAGGYARSRQQRSVWQRLDRQVHAERCG